MSDQNPAWYDYHNAEDPNTWLYWEIAQYLYKDELDNENPEEENQVVRDHMDGVLDRLDNECATLFETQVDDEAAVLFCVHVDKGETAVEGKWRNAPSPQLLLRILVQIADPGDSVTVTQVTGEGKIAEYASQWPFGMEAAEMMTAPLLGETAQVELAGVRRALGDVGMVYDFEDEEDAQSRWAMLAGKESWSRNRDILLLVGGACMGAALFGIGWLSGRSER